MNWTLSVEKKRCGLFKRILLLKSFENPVKLNPWPRWQRQRVNLNIGNFIKFRRNDVNNLKRIYIYIYWKRTKTTFFNNKKFSIFEAKNNIWSIVFTFTIFNHAILFLPKFFIYFIFTLHRYEKEKNSYV